MKLGASEPLHGLIAHLIELIAKIFQLPNELPLTMTKRTSQFSVAIVGGGVAGMTLTIALAKRGIDVQIFEQAPQFTEIGAGIAFSPNAKQAMTKCDPSVHEAYLRVATSSGSPDKINTWYDFVDGYTDNDSDKWLFDVTRDAPADGCHRAHFLEEMIKLVPEGVTHFNKHLDKIIDNGQSDPLTLEFSDGTNAQADIGETYSYTGMMLQTC
jgi:salicylate hydroxylase